MKIKVSMKDVKNSGKKIFNAPYCSLQHLLNYKTPDFYSASKNGWICDYYYINNIIICTGYATTGDNTDNNLIREYNNKASKIISSMDDNRINKVNKLLNNFIKKATNME